MIRDAAPPHPAIAALVKRANARLLAMSRVESPTYGQAANGEIIEELRDALRTLARPVEDEEVRRVAAALGDMADWFASRYTASANAEKCREAASLLARLAREKASAEQEAARLREENAAMQRVIDGKYGLTGSLWVQQQERIAELERALASAAGTEEPR